MFDVKQETENAKEDVDKKLEHDFTRINDFFDYIQIVLIYQKYVLENEAKMRQRYTTANPYDEIAKLMRGEIEEVYATQEESKECFLNAYANIFLQASAEIISKRMKVTGIEDIKRIHQIFLYQYLEKIQEKVELIAQANDIEL